MNIITDERQRDGVNELCSAFVSVPLSDTQRHYMRVVQALQNLCLLQTHVVWKKAVNDVCFWTEW